MGCSKYLQCSSLIFITWVKLVAFTVVYSNARLVVGISPLRKPVLSMHAQNRLSDVDMALSKPRLR